MLQKNRLVSDSSDALAIDSRPAILGTTWCHGRLGQGETSSVQ